MEHYLGKYLQLLEKQLQRGQLQNWKNADYEFISEDISEKTGIKVSSSTLKRVFNKIKTAENYQPQAATFLALANYLGYASWEHFISSTEDNNEKEKLATGIEKHRNKPVKKLIGAAVLLLAFIAVLVFFGVKPSAPVAGKTYLNADDTVVMAPQTVRFSYGLQQGITADSLVIALSNYETDALNSTRGEYYYTYEVPGYYKCQLRKNGSEIAERNILVVSNGWRSAVVRNIGSTQYQPVKLGLFTSGAGKMYVDPEELRSIDSSVFSEKFYLEYKEVRDYGISGDNLNFETRVKNIPEEGGMGCRKITVDLLGKKGRIRLDFFHKECIDKTAYLIFGDIRKNASFKEASGFWQELSDWHSIRVGSYNRQIEVFFDGAMVYTTTYIEEVGNIYSIIYGFEGCGSVDYVRMFDQKKSYSETFD